MLKENDILLVLGKGHEEYQIINDKKIYFSDKKVKMRVEVQLRTLAMDFWASLDHQMKYKKNLDDNGEISEELTACAELIAQVDQRMQRVRQKIDEKENPPSPFQRDRY